MAMTNNDKERCMSLLMLEGCTEEEASAAMRVIVVKQAISKVHRCSGENAAVMAAAAVQLLTAKPYG